MILADKITEERKKNGWSQEELANQLGVSRQAVSKWESAGAVPDLQRILQMSAFFTHFYKIIINQGYIKGVNIHRFFWLNLFICLEFARTFRA